jgi:hypothetical protein
MNIELLTSQINDTADKWIALLDYYSFDILLKKPDIESWSLGQVAMHIVTETGFYIEEIENCLSSNENISEQMTEEAKTMFNQNSFPDIKIKRDSSLSQFYPQPESKFDIHEKMKKLKVQLNHLLLKIKTSEYKGKTKHPGLGYFNTQQWIQFAEMHMRHHLRQKDRIEAGLNLC